VCHNYVAWLQSGVKGSSEARRDADIVNFNRDSEHRFGGILSADTGEKDRYFVRADVGFEKVKFAAALPILKFVGDEGMARGPLRELGFDGESD
jgi:hypothetical protein